MSLDVEILADQISRAFRGESWHGPSVLEVLAGVSAEDAAAHPIAGAHSIWEIVLHLAGGYTLVLRRLRGEGAQLSPEEDGLQCRRAVRRLGAKASKPWRN